MHEIYDPIEELLGSRVYLAKVKSSIVNRSSNLPIICYHRNYCALRGTRNYYTRRAAFSFFHSLDRICQIQRDSRAINAREKEREADRKSGSPMLDNLQDFLRVFLSPHCLLPRRRFFVLVIVRVIRRAAAPIISAAERALRGRQ